MSGRQSDQLVSWLVIGWLASLKRIFTFALSKKGSQLANKPIANLSIKTSLKLNKPY